MFNKLFRRAEPAPAPSARKPAVASSKPKPPRATPVLHEPPPVAEAVEDHDESAWDLWEQSQFQLDSQMGALSPNDSIKVRDSGKKGPEEVDPFALVGKNGR